MRGQLAAGWESRRLSAGSGVSVAYVFVHLLPEIAEISTTWADGWSRAGVLVGWLLSLVGEIDEVAVELALALLAGSVVLNVVKEELPEERQSRFWAFALGAVVYAAIRLAL